MENAFNKNVKLCGLVFAVIFTLQASDDPQVDLEIRAQTAFDHLMLAGSPDIAGAEACIQAQAALFPTAPAHALPLLHFRRAYCTIAKAMLTEDRAGFAAGANELDTAKAAWIAMPVAKKEHPLPVPVSILVLSAVARLETGPAGLALKPLRQELDQEVQMPCESYIVSAETCRQIVRLGNLWRARLATFAGDWQTAGPLFNQLHARGWADFSRGRAAFAAADYPGALSAYQAAITAWRSARSTPLPLLERLEPPPDWSQALTDLGGAQLVAGSADAALTTLNEAAKADPRNARSLYLRARTKDALGHADAALDDYILASRTAFADEADAEVAEGHFYRGIVMFRSKQFTRAENEFVSALNANPPESLLPDATAWKRYAAVAGGACGASRTALEQSLAAVSPFFPSAGARAAAKACDASSPAN